MTEIHEAKDRPEPFPTAWGVRCPCCGQTLEYEPEQDNHGAFCFDPANWPMCEECNVLFSPKAVSIKVLEAYDDDGL